MTLDELIETVDKLYDDGLIKAYYDPTVEMARDDKDLGDGLARFIVVELCETFNDNASDQDQLREAIRVLESAEDQLRTIINGLENKL